MGNFDGRAVLKENLPEAESSRRAESLRAVARRRREDAALSIADAVYLEEVAAGIDGRPGIGKAAAPQQDAPRNCSTCRHWGAPHSTNGVPDAGLRKCAAVPFYGEEHNGPPENPAALAYARDGEGYLGELLTRAGFGCVLHEPTKHPVSAEESVGAGSGASDIDGQFVVVPDEARRRLWSGLRPGATVVTLDEAKSLVTARIPQVTP